MFPFPEVDPHLDWPALRAALSREVTLLDQDPNPEPEGAVHDSAFDGFFAWVQPDSSGWDPAGEEWGEDYLHWFYRTMKGGEPYASKIAVGGVWPGFDDSLAPWGSNRFMSRAGGYVYDATWALAACHEAEIVMIATWNDFEEGTDVEFGVHMGVDMDDPLPEVLMRSAPLEVTWTNAGEDALQIYENGVLIYSEESHLPPVTIPSETVPVALESAGHAYEIKVWTSGEENLSQAVKIRRQDVDSGLFMNDGFESGNLCRWSSSAGAAP